jgi:predicted AAA+ superfamily ATPase
MKIRVLVQRIIEDQMRARLFKGKAILLFGARQTGKTTLLKKIVHSYGSDALWLNADEYDIKERFNNPTSTSIKALIGTKKLVILDEAHQIPGIGIALKLLVDTYPEIQVVASGSSAFELQNKTSEPLTGRKIEFQLFPLSYRELADHNQVLIEQRLLEHRLVFGSYPEVVNNQGNEVEVLKLLSDSFLYRDLLMLENIKKPEKLVKLLQALAYQIGQEVSYNEIGNLIGLDSKTVEAYVQLLEKSFVVFRLPSFSRNLRNELKASKKIYFYDNGIRNALISSFQLLEGRQDMGALWENYLVAERRKSNSYGMFYGNAYFWRTKEQQEIDYIEEVDGVLRAYEFKWKEKANQRITKTFSRAYPNCETAFVHTGNYDGFL